MFGSVKGENIRGKDAQKRKQGVGILMKNKMWKYIKDCMKLRQSWCA